MPDAYRSKRAKQAYSPLVDRYLPGSTDRLCFREYTSEDLDFVAQLFEDDQARRFYPGMAGEVKQRAWIDWNLINYRDHGFGMWVMELRDAGARVGDCGLTVQEVVGREIVEVGYHVAEEFRGRGYATEAGAACRDFAFDVLGIETICSIVDPRNEPSISVASRIHDKRTSYIDARGDEMLLFTTERVRGRM